ncbi:MAG: olfactory receptor [Clostridia bacterium]|jgi:hypothetical protein|nr:olfactory receptor [Clostridia bacterium]
MDTNNDTKTNKNEKSGCQSCLTVVIVSIIVLFSGCAITICLWPSPPSGDDIDKIVNNNKETILSAIKNGTVDDLKIDGVEEISELGDGSTIDFLCGYTGSAVSGNYSGFYYSEEDEPEDVFGISGELKETSEGFWECHEGDDSDNYYETDKICDNFYYYFAHC